MGDIGVAVAVLSSATAQAEQTKAQAGRAQAGRAQAGRAQAGRAQAGRAQAGQAKAQFGQTKAKPGQATPKAGQAKKRVRKRQAAVFAARGRPAVQHALQAMFDYDAMATAIASKRWKTLPPKKREQLRKLVRRGLMHNHERLLATKHKHDLIVTLTKEHTLTNARKHGPAVIVEAAVTPRNGQGTPIDLGYVVKGSRIVDLLFEGESQIRMFRSQIDRKIRKGQTDALLNQVKAKLAEPPTSLGQPFPHKSQVPTKNSDPVVAAIAGMAVATALVVAMWWHARY